MVEPRERKMTGPTTVASGIILLIGLGIAIYVGVTRRVALSGDIRYTAGKTIGFQLTASGRDVKYAYTVNGTTYENVATYAYNSLVPGGRYLVKFSVEHPESSEIFQDQAVPKDLVCPSDGWVKRPL
jgi:hypothetical protein